MVAFRNRQFVGGGTGVTFISFGTGLTLDTLLASVSLIALGTDFADQRGQPLGYTTAITVFDRQFVGRGTGITLVTLGTGLTSDTLLASVSLIALGAGFADQRGEPRLQITLITGHQC